MCKKCESLASPPPHPGRWQVSVFPGSAWNISPAAELQMFLLLSSNKLSTTLSVIRETGQVAVPLREQINMALHQRPWVGKCVFFFLSRCPCETMVLPTVCITNMTWEHHPNTDWIRNDGKLNNLSHNAPFNVLRTWSQEGSSLHPN